MKLTFLAISGIPLIEPGDDLIAIIKAALKESGESFQQDDVLVLAQKIVSKAENRYLNLADVVPGPAAIELASEVDKDPRHVEVILSESAGIVRKRPGVLIVEHKLGFVHANAGVDQSNIEHGEGSERVLLLPKDPDRSAAQLRDRVKDLCGVDVGVIINDSIGRAWRVGSLGLAIGVSGFTALEDYIGSRDMFDRELMVTQVGAADEMAAGASLVMGQTGERTPAVLVRGYHPREPADPELRGVQPLIRPRQQDLFR